LKQKKAGLELELEALNTDRFELSSLRESGGQLKSHWHESWWRFGERSVSDDQIK
jgi:hypothetical protein